MDIYDKFRQLGFSQSEAKTYIALLETGGANLKALEMKTSLHRANLLDALEKLVKKGAAGTGYAGKRKRYFPVEPKAVFGRVAKKTEEVSEELAEDLERIRRDVERSPVSIFHGKEGIKAILDEDLARGENISVIQSSKNVDVVAGSYLKYHREKRWRKGMRMRIMYGPSDRAYGKGAAKVPLTEVRLTGEELGPVSMEVCGDNAVLVFGEEPTIVRIMNKDVAQAFLRMFRLMWKNGRRVEGG